MVEQDSTRWFWRLVYGFAMAPVPPKSLPGARKILNPCLLLVPILLLSPFAWMTSQLLLVGLDPPTRIWPPATMGLIGPLLAIPRAVLVKLLVAAASHRCQRCEPFQGSHG